MNECIYNCIRTTSNIITTPSIDNRLYGLDSLRYSLSPSDNESATSHYWLCAMRWPGQHFYSVNFNLIMNFLVAPSLFYLMLFISNVCLQWNHLNSQSLLSFSCVLCVLSCRCLWIVHSSMPLPFFSIVYLKVFRVSIPHGLNSVVKIGRDYLYLRETLILISYSIWVSVPKQWLLVGWHPQGQIYLEYDFCFPSWILQNELKRNYKNDISDVKRRFFLIITYIYILNGINVYYS